MDRPGFCQFMKEFELGRVGTLVVWRLDRLGRTAKGLTSLFDDLIRWVGSIRGRRIRVTVEQIGAIRRLKSEGG